MKKNYKDLLVWKKSIEYVKMVYIIIKKFPDDEKFGLSSQVKRASVSIPSNIAEGSSRFSKKEFIRFLYISRGSLCELETLFIISKELNFIDSNELKKVLDLKDEIGKMIYGLINSLKVSEN